MAFPSIIEFPALGLSVSRYDDTGQVVRDVRAGRGLPYITPEENLPEDDAHRLNHVIMKVGSDLEAIRLASLLGLDSYLLMGPPIP